MTFIEVQSSNIAAVAYDPDTSEMRVRFARSGAEHKYDNVSASDHAAFMAAESKGRWFSRWIRERSPGSQTRRLHQGEDGTEAGDWGFAIVKR